MAGMRCPQGEREAKRSEDGNSIHMEKNQKTRKRRGGGKESLRERNKDKAFVLDVGMWRMGSSLRGLEKKILILSKKKGY